MECPFCGGKTRVSHSQKRRQFVYRRRVCAVCGYAFSTRGTETMLHVSELQKQGEKPLQDPQ
jgi:transcriptional regulator NrdR family protein